MPEYVCIDFAAHGHALRWQGHDSGSGRKTVAEMTDSEREEARAQRRDVIQSNKAWDSAETVRRNWLRTFLARKTAPKTAAGSLARTDHAVTSALTGGNRLAHDLLGLPDQAPTLGRRAPAMVELVGKASDERAQMIALGLLLAAYEEATSRNSWRTVSDSTTRYLRYLEANGYELSTVELRACGESPLPATDTNLAILAVASVAERPSGRHRTAEAGRTGDQRRAPMAPRSTCPGRRPARSHPSNRSTGTHHA
ncbi:hypothetical protein [Salinispora arenicola]|uniref:hypothetical protein n=1 Tax=Salinispora arenicola TaxID=168697 RepID=UPI0027DBA274|nr:hypothetical protein [Salinispora arenicola]